MRRGIADRKKKKKRNIYTILYLNIPKFEIFLFFQANVWAYILFTERKTKYIAWRFRILNAMSHGIVRLSRDHGRPWHFENIIEL